MTIAIAIESPLQDEVRALVAALDATLNALTPAEHNYPLNVEEMADPSMTVFVAREDGRAIACGALKRHAGGIGEIKRMYTRPQAQGRGIGGQMLACIEEMARVEGLSRLVLETGDGYAAAWRVYERGGFQRCGAVLDYPQSVYSVFFEKALVSEFRSSHDDRYRSPSELRNPTTPESIGLLVSCDSEIRPTRDIETNRISESGHEPA